jgi:Putative prokaryotic signal transducing protein
VKRIAIADSLAELGHFRDMLEQDGIVCVVKNAHLSGALGEVPFLETWPELWVMRDEDAPRAKHLLADLRAPADKAPPWRCRHCDADNDGEFAACWSCGQADPDAGTDGGRQD